MELSRTISTGPGTPTTRCSTATGAGPRRGADHALLPQGVTFDIGGEERAFPLDIMPRVIEQDAWAVVVRAPTACASTPPPDSSVSAELEDDAAPATVALLEAGGEGT